MVMCTLGNIRVVNESSFLCFLKLGGAGLPWVHLGVVRAGEGVAGGWAGRWVEGWNGG